MNPFGHVDLRVSDLDEAFGFYDALLPALGFTTTYHGDEWKVPAGLAPGVPEPEEPSPTKSR